MALTSGTRLGPYEILAPLGAGGIGEVYRSKEFAPRGRSDCQGSASGVRHRCHRRPGAILHPDVVDGREVGTVQEADGFRLWKRQSISLFAVIFGFLSIACFPSQPVSVDGEKGGAAEKQGLGSLRLSPAAFGQLILTPTSCAAGERQLFLGADFADEAAGVVVRLVVDPLDGPAVRVFAIAKPFDNSVVWRRTDCRIFHFSLESTGLRINRIEDYRIILDLDCSSQNGGSIEGHVSANHCH